MPWRSLRSPPALNARSPAPVRITQRRSPGVKASGPNTVRRSSEVAVLSALWTSGRLSRRSAGRAPVPRSAGAQSCVAAHRQFTAARRRRQEAELGHRGSRGRLCSESNSACASVGSSTSPAQSANFRHSRSPFTGRVKCPRGRVTGSDVTSRPSRRVSRTRSNGEIRARRGPSRTADRMRTFR